MRVLIIGGTGWLGPFVAEVLLEHGHQVTLFHRGKLEHPMVDGLPHIHGDRQDAAALMAAMAGQDAVVDTHPVDIDDARSVLRAIKRHDIRATVFVLRAENLWAGAAFGDKKGPTPVPIDETIELRNMVPADDVLWDGSFDIAVNVERPHYRVALELYLLQRLWMRERPICLLRFPDFYGPYDPYGKDYRYFMRRILDGRKVLLFGGGGNWLVQRVYIRDAARAVVLALENQSAMGELFHGGDKQVYPLGTLVQIIGRLLGVDDVEITIVPDSFLPDHLQTFAIQAQQHILDTSKLRRVLGFQEELPFLERWRRTVDWSLNTPTLTLEGQLPEEIDWAGQYAAEDAALAEFAALDEAADEEGTSST